MNFNSDLTQIKGIGEKTASLFAKLDITTIKDLLYHFPTNYVQFEEAVSICDVSFNKPVTIMAEISSEPIMKNARNLKILTFSAMDSTGTVQITFFNMPYLKNTLKKGKVFYFHGMIQIRGNNKIMEHPQIYKQEEYPKLLSFIQPKYSLTKGLTNQSVLKAMKQVLSFCALEETLSEDIIKQYDLMNYRDAMNQIHFPKDYKSMLKARKRLVFDEFFFFILMLRKTKMVSDKTPNYYPMIETADTTRFLEKLPFELTSSQLSVWKEIKSDLTSAYSMNRLIQGDVGSGKTVLAVLSILFCIANGYQAAMMAPTEVLSKQHFDTINEYTKKFHLPLKPVLLVGSMTQKEKQSAYQKIENGNANVIIGTHALIQDNVKYSNLSLVITDEQHRFGVRQREKLAQKGNAPHVLVMSATPIPRTLAIILYGDMYVSIIDKMPEHRLPIKNCVVDTSYRKKAYEFICKEIKNGRQAYIICPMVEDNEEMDLENVTDYTKTLKTILPGEIQVGCLHGKMRSSDKNQIMQRFADGQIDLLVSTTVVEVGVNVPNATVMMIENAQRFGLAQLHQLRGRVGRGDNQSYCIFVNTSDKKESLNRLEILNKSNDGFFIAGEDLRLRGPGDLFGIMQSGSLPFRIGDIYNDADLLKLTSECVDNLLEKDQYLDNLENRYIKTHLNSSLFQSVDFRSI